MAIHIRRREFIVTLGSAPTWPLAARAQQSGKPQTIGFLGAGTPATASAWVAAFMQRLHELGWIEDRTIRIDLRWAEARNDRSAGIAADFVRLTTAKALDLTVSEAFLLRADEVIE
jgi:putative ABC transport system substrate-binding protein